MVRMLMSSISAALVVEPFGPAQPERRHLDVDDLEAVVEILTEAACPHLLGEILAGRRDEARDLTSDGIGANEIGGHGNAGRRPVVSIA